MVAHIKEMIEHARLPNIMVWLIHWINYFFVAYSCILLRKKFPGDHVSMEKHNENKMNKMFKIKKKIEGSIIGLPNNAG